MAPVERPAGQDVGTHDEADAYRGDDPQVALLRVDRCGIDGVDQPRMSSRSLSTNAFQAPTPDDRAKCEVACPTLREMSRIE